MELNHISEVKVFLKEIKDILKVDRLFCIGETAVSILDGKIPKYYFLLSDLEISNLYKIFDKIENINIYPFSFYFQYKNEDFFICIIEKGYRINKIQEVEDFLKAITYRSFLIPLLYDVESGTIKNLNYCFSLNKNNEQQYLEKYLFIKSRYSDYANKILKFEENKNHSKLYLWVENKLKEIEKENNSYGLKLSILYLVLISMESKTLIWELSNTNFFVQFFPNLQKCKYHMQSKEYHPEGTLYDHLIRTAMEVESNDFALKIAALLHDIGKIEAINSKAKENNPKYPNHATISANIAKKYIDKLKDYFLFYPNLVEKVIFLIENHMRIAFLPDLEKSKQEEIIKSPYLFDLLKLLKADLKASMADLSIYKRVVSYLNKQSGQNFIRKF